jgi:hypothetical protein
MARDRAWSQEIIAAAIDGELDWQISSTNTGSVVLQNIDFESPNANKFMDGPSLSFKPGDQ